MFPLSKVRRFTDYRGIFVLVVRCTCCLHERPIAAQVLARRAPPGTPVADVVRRLRCSKCAACPRCNARQVEVGIAGIPR